MIRAERSRSAAWEGSNNYLGSAALTALLVGLSFSADTQAQFVVQASSAATEQLFNSVNSSVCTISAIATDGSYVSRGSGFVLDDSGLLVTNAHVLAGLGKASAKCGDQQLDIRRIVRFDRNVDLAIGEIGPVDVPGLSLAAGNEVRPGTQIFVFGSPFGLEGTITPGLASGQRVIDGRSYLQISAPISAGSSGGPVTDENGDVIGIAVASLEVGQNINFAIPSSAIAALPEVDMQPVQLAAERSGVNTAPTVQGPSLPIREAVAVDPGTAKFRGNAFGSPCGDIAVAEFDRQGPVEDGRGEVRFDRWFDGTLEFDVDLLGTPATAFYDCDGRLGMTTGYYRIRGHADGVDKIESALQSKYGTGVAQTITESDAAQRGCQWNFSLPGSRFYRPSELKSWRVDDRFHIDMITCGGRSTTTFVYYSDPVLTANVNASRVPADESAGYSAGVQDSDL